MTFISIQSKPLPLDRFNQNNILATYQYPAWEASHQNRETVFKIFLENCLQVKNEPHWTYLTSKDDLWDDLTKSIWL